MRSSVTRGPCDAIPSTVYHDMRIEYMIFATKTVGNKKQNMNERWEDRIQRSTSLGVLRNNSRTPAR